MRAAWWKDCVRLPWNNYDKPVIVHCTRERLQGHGCYWLAKKQRDAKAAVQVCEDLVGEELFYDLFDQIHDIHPRPIVVAPAMPPDETTNALGRTFSAWLARELECRTVGGIHQTNSVKRDFITDPYYRITHSPSFEGDIEAGSAYILADDLYTMGGTLACLRGFIEQRGGSVIGMTTIGEKEGGHVRISLAQSPFCA